MERHTIGRAIAIALLLLGSLAGCKRAAPTSDLETCPGYSPGPIVITECP